MKNNFNDNHMGEVHREIHELPERKRRLFNKARDVTLSPGEKMEGLLSLQNFMESKPIPVKSPYFTDTVAFFSATSLSVRKKVLVPLTAIIVFALAGSTALAASEALPGDILYPVKLNINEKVETLIAVGGEAKAKVAVLHAVNRLSEAERLAAEGKISPSVQAELATRFFEETRRADDEVKSLDAEGDSNAAVEVNSDFENSLRVHHNVISGIAGESLSEIKNAVRMRLGASVDLREANDVKATALKSKGNYRRSSGGISGEVFRSLVGNESATGTANSLSGYASTTVNTDKEDGHLENNTKHDESQGNEVGGSNSAAPTIQVPAPVVAPSIPVSVPSVGGSASGGIHIGL